MKRFDMWGSGAPRIPATDEKGNLLWRETFISRGTLNGKIWLIISFITLIAFFELVKDTLPSESLEPYIDSRFALVIWLGLSCLATWFTVFSLEWVARVILRSRVARP